MKVTTYKEYITEVVKCDWCNGDIERKKTKHWVTGSRLCPECYKKAEDKWEKFLEEFKREMYQGRLICPETAG